MDIPDSIVKKLGSMGMTFNYAITAEAEAERNELVDKYCQCGREGAPQSCAAKIPVLLALLKRIGVPDSDAKAFSDAVESAGLDLEIAVRHPTIVAANLKDALGQVLSALGVGGPVEASEETKH